MGQLVLPMNTDYIFQQEDYGHGGLSMALEVIGLKYSGKKQCQMELII